MRVCVFDDDDDDDDHTHILSDEDDAVKENKLRFKERKTKIYYDDDFLFFNSCDDELCSIRKFKFHSVLA